MKWCNFLGRLGVCISLMMLPTLHVAADASPPALFLREVKITGDEFVALEATQPVNLADYWLGYNSSDTATTIVPTQQLPSQTLGAGQALLLTSDGTDTCDAVFTSRLSFSLSDTKGTLALRQLASSNNTSTFTTVDSVSWNKPGTTGTTTDPIDLRKEATTLTTPVWYHTPTAQAWQVGDYDSCTITFGGSTPTGVSSITWPQNDVEPPALIESLADTATVSGPYLPAADVGLLPPQITELLPNPTGTGTDGTDEFVELYNPNGAPFDLSGFILQTGLTTKHSYTFPAGTSLPPKGFVAFYSSQTGLTLSNTSGQADLEDPFGTVITQTDGYGTAKDGMAWALAKGTWYWTAKSTPNASNVVNQTAGSSIKTASSKKAAAAVKGASTTKSPLQGAAASAVPAATTASAPIHPFILVVVALLALGYGVYEYRNDLANRIHQFRANRSSRRAARK